MALLKTKDLRAMRPEDVRAKLKEFGDELMHERGVAAMGGAPASPGRIRALRTNIARIHTIMLEQERAAKAAPAKAKAGKAGPEKKEKKRAVKKEEKK
ncbi:MAG: large subunit ribosomal protein [Candidatus Thermoplasmatota archaeon]|nr:large subunit ribosomal protein [Candidatus Thermoplasmatota archaeon]